MEVQKEKNQPKSCTILQNNLHTRFQKLLAYYTNKVLK